MCVRERERESERESEKEIFGLIHTLNGKRIIVSEISLLAEDIFPNRNFQGIILLKSFENVCSLTLRIFPIFLLNKNHKGVGRESGTERDKIHLAII